MILLAYSCTLNLAPALQRAFKVQQSLFKDAWDHYDKVIVTDKPNRFPILSCPLIKSDCWRYRSAADAHPEFCLSACRNTSLEYADHIGAQWVLLLDADNVVIDTPDQLPETGFGAPINAQGWENEPPFDLNRPGRWMASQWFLLHRRFFSRRFCEDYVGYGREEADFESNVMRDVPRSDTNIRLIHLHHPARVSQTLNLDLFERRRALCSKFHIS